MGLKLFLHDKPVRAGALIRCEFTQGRVSAFVVEDGSLGKVTVPVDDGPLNDDDAPSPGDIIIDDGERVSWMTAERFAEDYAAVEE